MCTSVNVSQKKYLQVFCVNEIYKTHKFWIINRFWGNAHLPLPQANVNTYFSLRSKCWLREGVGGQVLCEPSQNSLLKFKKPRKCYYLQ